MNSKASLKAVVIDDEIGARELITGILAEDSEIKVIGEASNGRTAVETICKLKPNIVFLDIQMPDFDGFEVIRRLRLAPMPLVIFVTAYDTYAISAFEVNAVDYLLKPFSRKRFAQAVQRAKDAVRKDQVQLLTDKLMNLVRAEGLDKSNLDTDTASGPYIDEVTVQTSNRLYSLKLSDVDLIESADHYVKLISDGRSFMIHESISGLEGKLDPSLFTRIHRTKIVRVAAVKEIIRGGDRAYFIVLKDGSRHRISRSQLDKLPRLVPRTRSS